MGQSRGEGAWKEVGVVASRFQLNPNQEPIFYWMQTPSTGLENLDPPGPRSRSRFGSNFFFFYF